MVLKRIFALIFWVAFFFCAIFNCMVTFGQTSSFPKEKFNTETNSGIPPYYRLFMPTVTENNTDQSVPKTYFSPVERRNEPRVKFIDLPGRVKLEYAEQGDPSGTPVIFLHGISDSWHSFQPVLPYLPQNIHAFAISQRGHGDSDKPMSGYSTKDFAADINDFMQELKIESAIVVGHSMGSTVAQRFAVDFPQRTRGLVLVGTFAKYEGNTNTTELESIVASFKDPVDTAFAREFQSSTIVKPVTQEYYNLVVNESLKLPARVWKAIVAEWYEVDYVESLKKFSKPTLIIWGEKDAYCPRVDQEILADAIQNSKLLIYDGTGHAVHWEEPRKFASDLLEFTKKTQ